MWQTLIHYGIHIFLPLAVAFAWYRNNWKFAYLIMISCMAIDADHLLATPVFEANRCSINFHPLHSYYAISVYLLLLVYQKTRILGFGLMAHIIADTVDCWMMTNS
ncbi:MAG TPA: DUF6122 family protein [Aquaticitalea sp.]|nr:DUF6122 family protein [Aquaticitalea sp.]HNU60147.1 DUF6122 family protein [Aquaticitalea sp.]